MLHFVYAPLHKSKRQLTGWYKTDNKCLASKNARSMQHNLSLKHHNKQSIKLLILGNKQTTIRNNALLNINKRKRITSHNRLCKNVKGNSLSE